jgi:hypothetical protein
VIAILTRSSPGAQMTEIQERLARAGVLSRLDDLIRRARVTPGELTAWSGSERAWFSDLLHPLPPEREGESRLLSGEEPAPRITIFAALLQEYPDRGEVRKQVERVYALWRTLESGAPLSGADISEISRVAAVLRRYFLENAFPGEASAGLGSVTHHAA